ncbi:MAG: superoxide dismutase family protein [Sphingomonadaceae bacterium]|nr:superoxide dismutase family protein [Sphingomonadaceae bacterium]
MNRCLVPIVAAVASLGLQGAPSAAHDALPDKPLHVPVIGSEGQAIGMAVFEQTAAGVLIDVGVKGLTQGEHAFHIHARGTCNPEGGFKSAGGHFAPGERVHGIKDTAGPHAGDMPNQFVGSDGSLRAQVLNSAVTLAAGGNALMDADGSALVIHAGADDYVSQPSGAAGPRVACAVIFGPRKN